MRADFLPIVGMNMIFISDSEISAMMKTPSGKLLLWAFTGDPTILPVPYLKKKKKVSVNSTVMRALQSYVTDMSLPDY
jgi:hypothetical protein